jgi:CHAT domain-containing protein
MKNTVSIGLILMAMVSFSQSTLIGNPATPPPEDSTSSNTIHIATHGFFQEQAELDSILLRNGLITPSTNIDSVLTAYEAMNLNLDNTDLVVLSVVDTSKFDSSNGVYGLQADSLSTGPKYILYASSEKDSKLKADFMSKFYALLLASGNDYQEAYDQTVAYFKEKEIELDFKHELVKNK